MVENEKQLEKNIKTKQQAEAEKKANSRYFQAEELYRQIRRDVTLFLLTTTWYDEPLHKEYLEEKRGQCKGNNLPGLDWGNKGKYKDLMRAVDLWWVIWKNSYITYQANQPEPSPIKIIQNPTKEQIEEAVGPLDQLDERPPEANENE